MYGAKFDSRSLFQLLARETIDNEKCERCKLYSEYSLGEFKRCLSIDTINDTIKDILNDAEVLNGDKTCCPTLLSTLLLSGGDYSIYPDRGIKIAQKRNFDKSFDAYVDQGIEITDEIIKNTDGNINQLEKIISKGVNISQEQLNKFFEKLLRDGCLWDDDIKFYVDKGCYYDISMIKNRLNKFDIPRMVRGGMNLDRFKKQVLEETVISSNTYYFLTEANLEYDEILEKYREKLIKYRRIQFDKHINILRQFVTDGKFSEVIACSNPDAGQKYIMYCLVLCVMDYIGINGEDLTKSKKSFEKVKLEIQKLVDDYEDTFKQMYDYLDKCIDCLDEMKETFRENDSE